MNILSENPKMSIKIKYFWELFSLMWIVVNVNLFVCLFVIPSLIFPEESMVSSYSGVFSFLITTIIAFIFAGGALLLKNTVHEMKIWKRTLVFLIIVQGKFSLLISLFAVVVMAILP